LGADDYFKEGATVNMSLPAWLVAALIEDDRIKKAFFWCLPEVG